MSINLKRILTPSEVIESTDFIGGSLWDDAKNVAGQAYQKTSNVVSQIPSAYKSGVQTLTRGTIQGAVAAPSTVTNVAGTVASYDPRIIAMQEALKTAQPSIDQAVDYTKGAVLDTASNVQQTVDASAVAVQQAAELARQKAAQYYVDTEQAVTGFGQQVKQAAWYSGIGFSIIMILLIICCLCVICCACLSALGYFTRRVERFEESTTQIKNIEKEEKKNQDEVINTEIQRNLVYAFNPRCMFRALDSPYEIN